MIISSVRIDKIVKSLLALTSKHKHQTIHQICHFLPSSHFSSLMIFENMLIFHSYGLLSSQPAGHQELRPSQRGGALPRLRSTVIATQFNYFFQVIVMCCYNRDEKQKGKALERLLENSRVMYWFGVASKLSLTQRCSPSSRPSTTDYTTPSWDGSLS